MPVDLTYGVELFVESTSVTVDVRTGEAVLVVQVDPSRPVIRPYPLPLWAAR